MTTEVTTHHQRRMTDALMRFAGCLFFLFLSLSIIHTTTGDGGSSDGGMPWGMALVRMIGKTCTASFFAIVAWVTLVRPRPQAQAKGWQPRLIAVAGSFLIGAVPFLPHEAPGMPLLIGSTLLIVLGNILSLYVLMRLGHSFSIMSLSHRLVTGGPYALVRHPLYAVEGLAIIGILLQHLSWPAVAIVALQFCCQVKRMSNEERVLSSSFPEYAAYAARTRRLVPGLW